MEILPPRHIPIVIVGSGFAGIGMAIRLKQSGFLDFAVMERATEVGGTWRDNSYPGCACDVESVLYSYSFAPNPRWTRLWSPQPEILQYLKDCADNFEVRSLISFDTRLESARWDQAAGRWNLQTSRGEWTCHYLISAMGALSEPSIPKLPGAEKFRGHVFHSAQWDHNYDLTGRRIAIIGTGASAIQFVPKIQPQVAHLSVFQRTAPWILPHHNPLFSRRRQRMFARFPGLLKIWRLWIYLFRELTGRAFHHLWMLKVFQQVGRIYLRYKIKSAALRKKLTPDYTIGCKRILISSSYYSAISQSNVDLITESIDHVSENSVVTRDGVAHPVDAMIYGTGFRLRDMHCSSHIFGREGQSLTEVWRGSPRAHLGTTMNGFPNFFMLFGPNTGLGHNSVMLMAESQIAHVLNALKFMRQHRWTSLEPRGETQDEFNSALDKKMRGTVWVSGCSSWYLDGTGRNSTLWPSSVGEFKRRVEPFRESEYILR